ncbi:MAG: methionine--tRNA ligase subunit beta [Candidatus Berkelbacteria bacterium]|nr:methionine--tRNA ligase subunit beta [Candidatus Berkelbacteria bacterium]MCR4308064.1 methionine--tRNA ligase subunit beta [Candidatus Berkelbacteria bacterium]
MSISIEDFQQLDIRIGSITQAERLEDSKKLLKLTVDFGDETRTILAGIGKTVEDPATLVGTQAPFLTNLEPKELAGVISNGMMLCASNDDTPVILAPVTEVKPGSKIS